MKMTPKPPFVSRNQFLKPADYLPLSNEKEPGSVTFAQNGHGGSIRRDTPHWPNASPISKSPSGKDTGTKSSIAFRVDVGKTDIIAGQPVRIGMTGLAKAHIRSR